MMRTINWPVLPVLCSVMLAAAAPMARSQGSEAKTPSVAELVAQMRARQEAVDSVRMAMISEGRFPGGSQFEIRGEIRVLGTTHVHITTKATFEDDVTAESETVKTPQGVWIRETDPAHGVVYLHMEPELVEQLERAQEVLGGTVDAPGALGNMAKDPLGAAMLESLDRSFALEVERRILEGEEYFVVKGDARGDEAPTPAGEEGGEPLGMPDPDRVELLIRAADLSVRQMVHLSQGRPLTKVVVTELELDLPMEKSSFALELPPGARFIDVMDHLPAATHIQSVLDDAAAAEAARRAESKAGAGREGEAADGGAAPAGTGKDAQGEGGPGGGRRN